MPAARLRSQVFEIVGAPYGTAPFQLNQPLAEKWDTKTFHDVIMLIIPSVPPSSSSNDSRQRKRFFVIAGSPEWIPPNSSAGRKVLR